MDDDQAFKALTEGRLREAIALYAARLRADPADDIARTNRAVALYDEGRWAEAEAAFEDVLRREGPFSEVAAPALFSLGYCRLELDDDVRSLQATTLFLELAPEGHPLYFDGVQNSACAWGRLGHDEEAAGLYRGVLSVRPHAYAYNGLAAALGGLGRPGEGLSVIDAAVHAGHSDSVLERTRARLAAEAGGPPRPTKLLGPLWPRLKIIRTSLKILGWDREPLPSRPPVDD